MTENNIRERITRLEERVKTLFTNQENMQESIDKVDVRIEKIFTNDLAHVQQNREFWLKVTGLATACATVIGIILKAWLG